MRITDLFNSITHSPVIVKEERMSPFLDQYQSRDVYYHGTSSNLNIGDKLLPPDMTDVLSEKGRLKNTNKVFFTKDIGSAKIYAGRSVNRFGGRPIIYKISPVGQITTLQDTPGTTVYFADWAYVVETINTQ